MVECRLRELLWEHVCKLHSSQVKVLYGYTLDPYLDGHRRIIRVLELCKNNIPFATRDDMLYIKAKSLAERSNDEARKKYARDFIRLAFESKGPLVLRGL